MELKVFLGTFRYIETGEAEHVIATTQEQVQQALIEKMRWYLSNTDEFCKFSKHYDDISDDYQELMNIGRGWEYYECFIEPQVVQDNPVGQSNEQR